MREEITNNHVDRVRIAKLKLKKLNCIYCPPGKGENASQYPRHGTQKSRKRIRRENSYRGK